MAVTELSAGGASFPIVDSHVHLYDPTRPQGVPWPNQTQTSIYRTFLPAQYCEVVKPFGVVGMIAVECSPWVDDNYWVLDVAARDTIVVGTVGSLHPGKQGFREHIARLHKNPLFRGVRFGYLWGRNVADELSNAQFISDLKALSEAGLALDTVGDARVLTDVVKITDRIPELRVIIDHLPNVEPPQEAVPLAAYHEALRELGNRPQVYAKVSEILHPVDKNGQRVRSGGGIAYELSVYRPRLDEIYEVFGPDRLLFASDWTNSEPMGTYAQTVGIVLQYFRGKGGEVAEKFFWKNSVSAYRWVNRPTSQPPRSGA